MSGPQGPDQTQPWPGQDQPSSDPSQQQTAWGQQPTPGQDQPAWQQQPPAYSPQQYPSYQQPGQQPTYQAPQQYPSPEQYGQHPAPDYSQQAYPQYGQQYGQQPGPYGQQPGQYGQPGQYPQYGSTESQEGSKRSLAVVGGVIGLLAALIVAVVAVLGFWKPGFFVTTKLDVNAAQSGVQQILTDESNGYGAKNVKDVKCNNGQSPTVKKGETFDCEVSIDGTKRQVTVTFQDNDGTYEVGRPK
ncbi:hypothetical protein A5662_17020 [Mycobacteriaceae bacterium 1482268.1]|nr:hypothetical protein A5662_17020 [Mycobacteriaceae bacterium 1482268.1]